MTDTKDILKETFKKEMARQNAVLDYQYALELNKMLLEAVKTNEVDVVKAIINDPKFKITKENATETLKECINDDKIEIANALVSHPSVNGSVDGSTVRSLIYSCKVMNEAGLIKKLKNVLNLKITPETLNGYPFAFFDFNPSRNSLAVAKEIVEAPELINNYWTSGEWVTKSTFLTTAIERERWGHVEYYLTIDGVDPTVIKGKAHKLLKKKASKSNEAKILLEKMEQIILRDKPDYFGKVFHRAKTLKL